MDMRLLAIHGLAHYATEEEIDKVIDHFLKILMKRPETVEKQYDAMPDAIKGHFTFDENGEAVQLRRPHETKQMIERFFTAKNGH
ncbi:hypothetical protein ABIE48_003263 [Paenibacillus sp. OAE614]